MRDPVSYPCGHPRTLENSSPTGRSFQCRTCMRQGQARYVATEAGKAVRKKVHARSYARRKAERLAARAKWLRVALENARGTP